MPQRQMVLFVSGRYGDLGETCSDRPSKSTLGYQSEPHWLQAHHQLAQDALLWRKHPAYQNKVIETGGAEMN